METKLKILIGAVVFLWVWVSLVGVGQARVSGVCSNCHTMHNSQNGQAIKTSGPNPYLLDPGSNFSDPCVGCHSNTTAETIVTVGSTRIPIVVNLQEPTYPSDGSPTGVLAGGNFYWLITNGDVYGHNVLAIDGGGVSVSQDANLSQAPGMPDSASGGSCAGCHRQVSRCESCHKPAHHADDSGPVVGESGGWYRFLNSSEHGSSATGVIGIEDSDWEQTVSATDHNEYNGTNNIYGNDDNSMSNYCAGCHYKFHGVNYVDTDGNVLADNHSPWFRHPNHIALPNDPNKEYYYYNNPGGTGPGDYNPIAPVARDPNTLSGMTGPTNIVTPGSDQVMCLSCHRPHGSPYPDMLRWDYLNACIAGTSNANCGCFVCHTTKGQ